MAPSSAGLKRVSPKDAQTASLLQLYSYAVFFELMNAFRFESDVTKTGSGAAVTGAASSHFAGDVIADRYKLTRKLGSGGMGVVWAAESLALGVEVAVKLMQTDTPSRATSERMMREAQAAARLSHPALVRVFDFGFFGANEQPYLVMELVQGETLRAQLEREGALPAIAAVKTLLPIADGLRTAHERGIVHRDLKPDNILIAKDALKRVQPKILDFGIAKDALSKNKITQAGCIVGTPQYVSPEQAKGLDSVDARSDVWSFCVMLYELLTGQLPFDEPNYNAQLFAIIERPPAQPIRGIGDTRLWQIVFRGLAKNPADRYQSIGQLGEALAAWLHDHHVKVDAAGNALRTVWLDNVTTVRNTVSPVSKPSRFAPPRMGSGHSRLPPGQSHTLQALGLVFAVAASVFALFELTFARFHAVEHPEPPKPVAVSEQPRPAAQPDAPLVHPDVVPEPTSVAAIAATSGSAVSIHKTQPHRRNQVASAPGKAVVSTPTNKLVTSSSADAPTATKGKTAKPRHDFGF